MCDVIVSPCSMGYIWLLLFSSMVMARRGNSLSILTIQSDHSEIESDGWGVWGEWQPCSRSCGGGITFMQRGCRNNTLISDCVGEDKMYSTCNIQDCPVYSEDFRVKQCAEFNDIKQYKGSLHHWLPYYGEDADHNPCSLYCQSQNGSYDAVKLKEKVIDGTRCGRDSFHSCVDGKCQEMGCDMILGSDLELDSCGECGGDGTYCKITKGTTRIPKEIKDSSGSVAVGRNETKRNFNLIYAAGVDMLYEKKHGKRHHRPTQSVFIRGPTAEKLQFEIVTLDRVRSVSYQYYLPIGAVVENSFEWKIREVGNCTKLCERGWHRRRIKCMRNDDVAVTSSACGGMRKPKTWVPCNAQKCQRSWQADEWGECSSPCNGGKQTRDVYCVEQSPFPGREDVILKKGLCDATESIDRERECNTHLCQEWQSSDWSQCSTTCGTGTKTREVKCITNDCNDDGKPRNVLLCNLGPCSDVNWVVTKWTECTEGCGKGMTTRIVECADNDGLIYPNSTYCNATSKPTEILPCYSTRNCPDPPKWMTGSWSPCSVNCGSGIQTRRVVCSVFAEGAIRIFPDHQCLEASVSLKPPFLQNCVKPRCQSLWFSGVWGACSVTCGKGFKSRRVFCGSMDGKKSDDDSCNQIHKPNQTEICTEANCLTEEVGCQSSTYGCCEDGVTAASGPNYTGCIQPTTQQSTIVSALDCHLPVDQGPCTAWEVKWQFNPQQKSCVRFWYGGCDGNANKFSSEHDCLESCKNTNPTPIETSTQSFVDVTANVQYSDHITAGAIRPSRCLQASNRGSCQGNYKRWYFSDSLGDCVQFYYSGCEGNGNNFESRDSCLNICKSAFLTINKTVEQVSVVAGESVILPCAASGYPRPEVRWLYNNGSEVQKEKTILKSDFSLEIHGVEVYDEDTYICIAKNSAGLEKQHSVVLSVQTNSLFYQLPVDTTVNAEDDAVIQCRITPEVVFMTWHKDDKHRIQTWGDLHIYDVDEEDSGRYICSAYSEDAVKTASANLRVTPKSQVSQRQNEVRYAAAYRPSTSRRIELFSHSRRMRPNCQDQTSILNCNDVVSRDLCSLYHTYCCQSCRRDSLNKRR